MKYSPTRFQKEVNRILDQISRMELLDPAKKTERLARCQNDRVFFLKTYLPHYFTHEFSKLHYEALDFLDNLNNEDAIMLWPRDWGKTSLVTIGDTLWKGLTEKSRFTLIGGDTEEVAIQKTFLIKLELETNPRIQQDFGTQKGHRKWEDADFVTRKGFIVRALGQKSKWRGHNYMGLRPDRIVLDDMEDNENIINRSRVKKRIKIILTEIMGAMQKDSYELIMNGNMFGKRSAIAKFVENKQGEYSFKVFKIDCEDKDGNSSWPERYTNEDLAKKKGRMGPVNYRAEMRHKPADEGVMVKEDWIQYLNPDELPSRDAMRVVGFIDPSFTSKETSDFKAIVVCGFENESAKKYVLDSFIRHCSPSEMLDAAYRLDERNQPSIIGMEDNSLKDFLRDAVHAAELRKGRPLPWKAIHHKTNKEVRISRVTPSIEQGDWYFVRHGDYEELIEQWIDFGTTGMHDDGPDAHAGCFEIVERTGGNYIGFVPHKRDTFKPVGEST